MKRTRIVGLCLLALGAIFAFTASSAFAVEGSLEFGKCVKKEEAASKFKNSGCTKLAGGEVAEHKFEWTPLSTIVKFTSKKKELTGKAVLEAKNGNEISCTEQVQTIGEYGPGNTQIKNVIGEFSGCEASGAECNSAGKAAGHIDTFKLHGEPGVVKKEASEEKNIDGTDLRGETSELLAEFTCGPLPVKVRGGVITKTGYTKEGKFIRNTNKMLNKATVEFVAEKPGKQVPEEWTPLGSGISNNKKELIKEFLEGKVSEAAYEQSGQSLITVQKSNPTTVKVELRQCKQGVC